MTKDELIRVELSYRVNSLISSIGTKAAAIYCEISEESLHAVANEQAVSNEIILHLLNVFHLNIEFFRKGPCNTLSFQIFLNEAEKLLNKRKSPFFKVYECIFLKKMKKTISPFELRRNAKWVKYLLKDSPVQVYKSENRNALLVAALSENIDKKTEEQINSTLNFSSKDLNK